MKIKELEWSAKEEFPCDYGDFVQIKTKTSFGEICLYWESGKENNVSISFPDTWALWSQDHPKQPSIKAAKDYVQKYWNSFVEDQIKKENPRYVIHEGYARDRSGNTQFFSAPKLCGLYGLTYSKRKNVIFWYEKCYRYVAGDIHLYPKEDGKYKLPDLPSEP
jgi:hypothetical protein